MSSAAELCYTSINLYDGAMQCDIPVNYIDLSHVRDIPDHQCIYNDSDLDSSIIIELNQSVESMTFNQYHNIAVTHYIEYCTIQNAQSYTIESSGQISSNHIPNINGCTGYYVHGTMNTNKYNESVYNNIRVYMYVIHLTTVSTDLCIILNAPAEFDANSTVDHKQIVPDESYCRYIIQQLLNTIKINDWSLFG